MSSSVFDAAIVRSLAVVLTETGLAEIEVSDGDRRIRLTRTAHAAPAAVIQAGPPPSPLPPATLPAMPSAAPIEPGETSPGTVTSPMVGIAYLAPEPGAPPFVAVGTTVAAGQTVMLIEAMKTFNQIKAPRSGTVTRILVAPGAPVEYGEALLVIE